MIYRSKDGDMVDLIAFHHGVSAEALLNTNRHLSRHAPVLKAGVELTIPEAPQPTVRLIQPIRLWGKPRAEHRP